MNFNNVYNFKNPIRHFVNIDSLNYPSDITTFPVSNLSWTLPIPFKIQKEGEKFRTIKLPNPISFMRAYHYYSSLPNFLDLRLIDPDHKRLSANLDTGDFVSGEYDRQLNNDFMNLCLYDSLLKLDIEEYYGKIYTHYLELNNLEDFVLAGLNNGRTGGIIMGNYLSLYFAESMLQKISANFKDKLTSKNIPFHFEYFSDDFYIFCNSKDINLITTIFDESLQSYDFKRNESKQEIWTYEDYNSYNLLTRYWKSIIRHWNLELLKDYEIANNKGTTASHTLSFLNQIIYRVSSLSDLKNKRALINNFFKTKYFQETNFNEYIIKSYDYHQLCFLLSLAPESLLYTSHIFNAMNSFNNEMIKDFLSLRYKAALDSPLNDVQLYYYYAIKSYGFSDLLSSMSSLVINSENQILISYYLKDTLFSQCEIDALKLLEDEQYWFQNYHLILYSPDLMSNLGNSIAKYLVPQNAISKTVKENTYKNFYTDNLTSGIALIQEIQDVTNNIQSYLSLRHQETAVEFDDTVSGEDTEDIDFSDIFG